MPEYELQQLMQIYDTFVLVSLRYYPPQLEMKSV
jgi:hypothetical protein